MSEEKARYTAALQGAEIDLKLLERCFSTDACRVEIAEHPQIAAGKFYLFSSTDLEMAPTYEKNVVAGSGGETTEFVLDSTWDSAWAEADRLLNIMHGAARLVRDQYKPVSIGSMHKFSLIGEFLGSMARSPFSDSWRSYPLPSTRTGLTELVRRWAVKGLEDEAVALVLSIYGTQPLGWTMLYMVYEIIKGDIGDDGISKLVPSSEIRDFKKSANHTRRLTDGPRHAFTTDLDDGDLITLPGAEAIIRRLMNEWLGSKVGSIMI